MEELETELLEVNSNSERLQRSYSELVELQLVLEKAGAFFDEARHEGGALSEIGNPLSAGGGIGTPATLLILCMTAMFCNVASCLGVSCSYGHGCPLRG